MFLTTENILGFLQYWDKLQQKLFCCKGIHWGFGELLAVFEKFQTKFLTDFSNITRINLYNHHKLVYTYFKNMAE